jgi:hypothetical protein
MVDIADLRRSRVSEETEQMGLDQGLGGETAYL